MLNRDENTKENIKVAIIGIGAVGKKYAMMISEGKIDGMILSAVCARSDSNRQWANEKLNKDVCVFESIDSMYEQVEFDTVLIATPHTTHMELTLEAFEHGKNVFCDKPAGISVDEAKKMNEAANKSDRVYAMMFHNRALPVYREIKRIIDSGELGRLRRIQLKSNRYFRTKYYHNSAKWRSSWRGEGGGCLINQGQHILDIWQWLFGMPKSLYAVIPFGKYNDFQVDDESTILMKYGDKLTATFILTTGEAYGEETLEIIGSSGQVRVIGDKICKWIYNVDSDEYRNSANEDGGDGLKADYSEEEFPDNEDLFEIMLNNFVKNVRGEEALIAKGGEGIKSLSIANAAYLSAWDNKEIELPINDQEYLIKLEQHRRAELI